MAGVEAAAAVDCTLMDEEESLHGRTMTDKGSLIREKSGGVVVDDTSMKKRKIVYLNWNQMRMEGGWGLVSKVVDGPLWSVGRKRGKWGNLTNRPSEEMPNGRWIERVTRRFQ